MSSILEEDEKKKVVVDSTAHQEEPEDQEVKYKMKNFSNLQDGGEVEPSPEIHFEPVVKLEQVETKTMEEEEDVFFKM